MAGPKTWGKDFDFFYKGDVVVRANGWRANADAVFNFRGQVSFSIVNEGTQVIEYSFNGNTLHGDLTPGTPTQAIIFDNRRVSRIWFRTSAPGQTIRVEAWASMT